MQIQERAQKSSRPEKCRVVSAGILFPVMETCLAEQYETVFTVTGMSMWPFLRHARDQVVLKQCAAADLKKGDVVLVQTPAGSYLLHRISRLGETWIETTGDGNWFRDGRFPKSCVRAKACSLIRKGRHIACDDRAWCMVSGIWAALYPLRPGLLWGISGMCRGKAWMRRRCSKVK